MNEAREFVLAGVARPTNAAHMLDQMCEHFVEHAEVERTGDLAFLKSKFGTARIHLRDQSLLVDLDCPSEMALQVARNSIAEHMFYFAGNSPFELTWSQPAARAQLPNLHEVTVVGTEDVTPQMRRVKLSCADVAPFVGGDMHVRILVPPRGRQPVWPGYRRDGRIAWPDGEDALLVRAYTIRAVDVDRREVWIDFVQHPACDVTTPGADFARDAKAGDKIALLGPGSGSLPKAASILLIGDESALPAIARIAAEVPEGTDMLAIIEVRDAQEQQSLPSAGNLDVRWLHRSSCAAGATGTLVTEARSAIETIGAGTYVWVACEKDDVRSLRSFLRDRGHDKKKMYAAWYWEK